MMNALPPRRLAIAPMLDWTDRHYRFFARLLTQKTWLYTEMVTTGALIHGDKPRFLDFSPEEHPIALQLGGSDPVALAQCAKWVEEWGYDEINLNVGCPSERVQSGAFGACLMLEPLLVADCLKAMQDKVSIPVTVKHRIGIDEETRYAFVRDFIGTVHHLSGCRVFIVHARNAILKGLSPKENREIPPLKYEVVYQLKRDFPHLEILINGGIQTYEAVETHLQQVDGVMVGRHAYHDPYWLSEIDQRVYGDDKPILSREAVIEALLPYIENHLHAGTGTQLKHISRHLLGLFQGQKGARIWRRTLSDAALLKGASSSFLEKCLAERQQFDAMV